MRVPKNKIAKYKNHRQKRSKSVELGIEIGAGFAGYTVTRFISRIVYSQFIKRFPNGAPHAAVGAGLLGAIGTFVTTKYWKRTSDYHESALIGAGIALLQMILQTYIPKFGWVVSDIRPDQYSTAQQRTAQQRPQLPEADLGQILSTEQKIEIEPPDEHANGDFDLDALLTEHPDVEAVEIGQAPPIDEELNEDDDAPIRWDREEFGDFDLETARNTTGLVN